MVFLKEVLFAPDTTRLSLEVRVRRVWLVRLQIRKQFWLRQAWTKVAAGNQRTLESGGRRDRQAWVLGWVQRPRKGGACGWAWGRVQTKKGRVRGRGLRSAGAGRRGQSWIPEATDASLGCLRESVSRPRQVGDGMRPGNEAAGPRFLNCRRCPWGVPCACASGLQGTGHLGPREGGWQPACEPQARSGARAEEPGRSRRKRSFQAVLNLDVPGRCT